MYARLPVIMGGELGKGHVTAAGASQLQSEFVVTHLEKIQDNRCDSRNTLPLKDLNSFTRFYS